MGFNSRSTPAEFPSSRGAAIDSITCAQAVDICVTKEASAVNFPFLFGVLQRNTVGQKFMLKSKIKISTESALVEESSASVDRGPDEAADNVASQKWLCWLFAVLEHSISHELAHELNQLPKSSAKGTGAYELVRRFSDKLLGELELEAKQPNCAGKSTN